jgi:hypothetical protein
MERMDPQLDKFSPDGAEISSTEYTPARDGTREASVIIRRSCPLSMVEFFMPYADRHTGLVQTTMCPANPRRRVWPSPAFFQRLQEGSFGCGECEKCVLRDRACSRTAEESQVESCEHQDNANIHCQPFGEPVSEEGEVYSDYDGCHRHDVEQDSYRSAHFSRNRHCDFSIRNLRVLKQPVPALRLSRSGYGSGIKLGVGWNR